MQTLSFARTTVAAAALLATTGCAQMGALGTLGDILGTVLGPEAGGTGTLAAEVQQVDTRQQQIHVRTQDGRTGGVLYDRNTQVIYRQQQYPVTALERGDLVTMEVQQDAQNRVYASRVFVEQSARERTTAGGAVRQVAGRVGQIDRQRGMFEVQAQQGGVLLVSLPYNPPPATVDRFQRLRTGDQVTVEGVLLADNRMELHRIY